MRNFIILFVVMLLGMLPMSVTAQPSVTVLLVDCHSPSTAYYEVGDYLSICAELNAPYDDMRGFEFNMRLDGIRVDSTNYLVLDGFDGTTFELGPFIDNEADYADVMAGRLVYNANPSSKSRIILEMHGQATQVHNGKTESFWIDFPIAVDSDGFSVPVTNQLIGDYSIGSYAVRSAVTTYGGGGGINDTKLLTRLLFAEWTVGELEGSTAVPPCNGNDMDDVTTSDAWCGWAEYGDSDYDTVEGIDIEDDPNIPDGEYFVPYRAITRAEVARALARTGYHKGMWSKNADNNDCEDFFSDPNIEDNRWCNEISIMFEQGLMLDHATCPAGYFCPDYIVTKTEGANLLAQLIEME
jgi:hypothetical protein